MLFHHIDEQGTKRYYLQRRSQHVDHPLTWGIPGGAIDGSETPYQAALREAEEELGHRPDHTPDRITSSMCPSGEWGYHTVHAGVSDQFSANSNWEMTEDGWFTPEEMQSLDLHPGFAQTARQL